MKLIKHSGDFKKYDILFNNRTHRLYKCTISNHVKPFERSTGGSRTLIQGQIDTGIWYNMGHLSDLMDGLVQKALKDIEKLDI